MKNCRENGLLYHTKNGVRRADVRILGRLDNNDIYDFIFLTVRSQQAEAALAELKSNKSRTIVTMINSITPYSDWEKICGEGRILPAFPGAGGGFKDGVLDAALTPAMIQPTTFGEIDGCPSDRQRRLAGIFKKSRIPYQIAPNMHNWQLCHLGLVVPLADTYMRSRDPEHVYNDRNMMLRTAQALKRNVRFFNRKGQLSPDKFRLILICPVSLMADILKWVYRSDFGDRFMYQHAMKAPDEMRLLHKELYGFIRDHERTESSGLFITDLFHERSIP